MSARAHQRVVAHMVHQLRAHQSPTRLPCIHRPAKEMHATLEIAMTQPTERHALAKDTPSAAEEILRRVQGEFLEMPGLRVTEEQARRLWGLDAATCSALLSALIDARFLFRTRDGAFMRIEHATPVKAGLPSRATGITAA